MSKISLILSALMTVAFVLLMAPRVFAMNQGKMLRNVATWLLIFTGLGLFYQTFGPESQHPLFAMPYGVAVRGPAAPPPAEKTRADDKADKDDSDKTDGSRGFTPPGE